MNHEGTLVIRISNVPLVEANRLTASQHYELPAGVARQNLSYTVFPWTTQERLSPLVISGGQGAEIWDDHGKRYLDFASQLVNVNVGHQHPGVVKAIQEQASRLCYVAPTIATDVRGELGRMISQVTPGDLSRSFFTLGGSDANDTAIKLARLSTGRFKIISRYRSYHGATFGALTISGDSRRWPFEPALPGIVRVFDPYCYRCTFGKCPKSCSLECVSHIEEVIWQENPNDIAAIIVESITGTNGVQVPPPAYMPELRRLCSRHGILLIADEVMTGWGRTGKWFAVDHWDVVPDMIVTAKGLTSGYIPMGAVIVSDALAHNLEKRMLPTGFTNGSHPLGCAAAIACIKAYKEEGLIDNASRLGALLQETLLGIKEKHACVGDVRSIGLFAGVELVEDRLTKAPLGASTGSDRLGSLKAILLEQGIYSFGRHNILVVAPPLCITEKQLREGLAIVDQCLGIVDQWIDQPGNLPN